MAERKRISVEKCPNCDKKVTLSIPNEGKDIVACPLCNLRIVIVADPAKGTWLVRKPVVKVDKK